MKRTIALVARSTCVGTASAQFGFDGIVYDPTNYSNMVFLSVEPKWDSLRCEPRFQNILRRLGFSQAV